jgi:hypothetical protein
MLAVRFTPRATNECLQRFPMPRVRNPRTSRYPRAAHAHHDCQLPLSSRQGTEHLSRHAYLAPNTCTPSGNAKMRPRDPRSTGSAKKDSRKPVLGHAAVSQAGILCDLKVSRRLNKMRHQSSPRSPRS